MGKRLAGRVLIILVALALAIGFGLFLYAQNLDNNVARIEPFPTTTRPTKSIDGPLNFLILGSDSRNPDRIDRSRADTIILAHVPENADKAYLISIPRDLYVPIPSGDSCEGRRDKINAALTGGIPNMVRAVECYTDVRIDHVMLVDFAGFKDVTNALGGVTMNVEEPITSIHPPFRRFEQGRQTMNGNEALDYVRQRYQYRDGDFQRMRNQQQFLKSLMDKATSTGTIANPAKLNAFLSTVSKSITVDEDMSFTDMAMTFRGIRSDDLTFMTSPNNGSATRGGQSVVLSDDDEAASLYERVKNDRME